MTDTEYKPVSTLAIVAMLLAVTGSLAFVSVAFIAAAVLSFPVAVTANRAIAKYAFSGRQFVIIGIALSTLTLPLAPAWHIYQYQSEALAGHSRLDFAALIGKPENNLDKYDSKRICLKGYALPSQNTQVQTFLLSADGNYKTPERAITVKVPEGWNYDYNPISVSGILIVNPNADSSTDRYTFAASAIQRVKTSYELAPRVPGDC